jgi:shikimate 5-dehydrogenase
VVVGLLYRRQGGGPMPLLAAAAASGAVTVDGREVLLGQARGQFQRMTGRELPKELARRLLGLPPAGWTCPGSVDSRQLGVDRR